jgi:hypothetical protein
MLCCKCNILLSAKSRMECIGISGYSVVASVTLYSNVLFTIYTLDTKRVCNDI